MHVPKFERKKEIIHLLKSVCVGGGGRGLMILKYAGLAQTSRQIGSGDGGVDMPT